MVLYKQDKNNHIFSNKHIININKLPRFIQSIGKAIRRMFLHGFSVLYINYLQNIFQFFPNYAKSYIL